MSFVEPSAVAQAGLSRLSVSAQSSHRRTPSRDKDFEREEALALLARASIASGMSPPPELRDADKEGVWEQMSPRVYRNLDEIFAGEYEG